MVIESLAASAIALLVPYLKKGVESFVEKSGEMLAEKTAAIFKAIKKKFTGDSYAEQTLERVTEQPESEGRQAALKSVLMEQMESDSGFSALVEKLVAEAKGVEITNVNVSGDRNVGLGGDNYGNISTGDTHQQK